MSSAVELSDVVVDGVNVSKPKPAFEDGNALPLLLPPLHPPLTLKNALFCCLRNNSSEASLGTHGGSQDMFAFHSNTRNYIKRRDTPAAAPAHSSPINFSTEWKCEHGVIWPKIVNYALQCCKGHNLSSYQPPPSSTTPVPSKLCRLCSAQLLLHPPPVAPHTTSHCLYCDYMICTACVDAVAPHSQRPPPPPPPSLLHRGVHLNVLRQFKRDWACTYSRWTTEQV
jgi:hypothetical protein